MTEVTQVPLLDLTRSQPEMLDELRAAFERILTSGRYIMGPEVTNLEQEIAAFLGVKHAIGVSSGTDALICALMALGIGQGDEVICPTYTFFATGGSIWRVGAKPVFVDSDPQTYNVTADTIAAAITDRTRAIMPVHLYGQCCDMGPILELAEARGIPIIEDAAQAISCKWQDLPAGGMGAFGCFSFFPSKNLGCMGDGGLVTTNNDQLAEQARIMRAHGGEPKYYHSYVGGNFRIDPLQAAVVRIKLPHLNAASEARRQNAQRYRELLTAAGVVSDDPVNVPASKIGLPVQVEESHIYNQFVVRVGGGRRDEVRSAMQDKQVGTEVYYPVPLHLQKCFASLGHKAGDMPHAERAANETLALPIFPELTDAEITYVAETLARQCSAD